MAIGQFKDWLKARLHRSFEGFERKMETTETSVSRNVIEEPNQESGGGMLDTFRDFLGKDKKPEGRGPMEVPR